MPAEQGIDARLQRRGVVSLAVGEEEQADAELVARRETFSGRDEALEEGTMDGEEEAGAVAGVLDGPAAMLDAGKAAESEVDQLTGGAGGIGKGPDTAPAPSRMVAQRARDASSGL